jgi:hypothetical protein
MRRPVTARVRSLPCLLVLGACLALPGCGEDREGSFTVEDQTGTQTTGTGTTGTGTTGTQTAP